MNVVYILVFDGFIKIGKASGELERIDRLKMVWGEFDKEKSLILAMHPDTDVFDVEKTFHKALRQHFHCCAGKKGKDGYTELFTVDEITLQSKLVAISHLFDFNVFNLSDVLRRDHTWSSASVNTKDELSIIQGKMCLYDLQIDFLRSRLKERQMEYGNILYETSSYDLKIAKRYYHLAKNTWGQDTVETVREVRELNVSPISLFTRIKKSLMNLVNRDKPLAY